MAQGINPVGAIGPGDAQGASSGKKPGALSFKDVLSRELGEVNDLQLDAEKAINDFVTGKTKNVSEAMVAVEKADLAFRNLMAVRNKIIDAYKEIQQMRI